MAVHALTEVEVRPGREKLALRTAVRLARRLAERPGFRGLRWYRSETPAGRWLVLSEWSEWEAATAAETEAVIAGLLAQARAACGEWESRRLEPLFHLQLPRRKLSAGLAQTLRAHASSPDMTTARQKEFGLRAMSLPGTIGVFSGRCDQDPGFYFCALEFDTEAAMADFAGSPTRHQWARILEPAWWHKESRLELAKDEKPEAASDSTCRSERLGSLSVHIESSPDRATVVLRLHGCLDDTAAERFDRVRETLIAGGCRDLTLDLCQLTAATPKGMKALVASARLVKEAGGLFKLVDNQGRYHQILRTWHLNQALDVEGAKPARRKVASVRLRIPGSA